MQIVRLSLEKNRPSVMGKALCLGDFDGVHLGHQELAKRALSLGEAAAFLFDKDPSLFLDNGKGKRFLTSWEDKAALFAKLGVETIYLEEVDASFFALPPERFLEEVLGPLSPKALVVGEDYRFGKGGAGTVEELAARFPVEVVPLLRDGAGRKIASRSIKAALASGEVADAAQALGRPYEVNGVVAEGFHNGRKIGFPTINLSLFFPYFLPQSGVYRGYAVLEGRRYEAIVNVGKNPTVGLLQEEIVEAHLKGFSAQAYGLKAAVGFLSHIRGERKFASLEELRRQLQEDERALD